MLSSWQGSIKCEQLWQGSGAPSFLFFFVVIFFRINIGFLNAL